MKQQVSPAVVAVVVVVVVAVIGFIGYKVFGGSKPSSGAGAPVDYAAKMQEMRQSQASTSGGRGGGSYADRMRGMSGGATSGGMSGGR